MARFFVSGKEKSMSEKRQNREGELYKTVELHGRRFALYYGYYEECDRENPLCEPIPIYPDFLQTPVYTDSGEPFVTVMQDTCDGFGGGGRSVNTTCGDCEYFKKGEELFGICQNPHNIADEQRSTYIHRLQQTLSQTRSTDPDDTEH